MGLIAILVPDQQEITIFELCRYGIKSKASQLYRICRIILLVEKLNLSFFSKERINFFFFSNKDIIEAYIEFFTCLKKSSNDTFTKERRI